MFVGKTFSLLSAENNYRISHYCEFVVRDALTDSFNRSAPKDSGRNIRKRGSDEGKGFMKPKRINADKPHLWKADIAASVDQFNEWFMKFAPEAFRSTRVKTTGHVKTALLATRDLRRIDAATLKGNPSALSTLRMCTAPPLAVDLFISD